MTIQSSSMTLDHAYAHCRAVAKKEAKNFYYAFVALPSARRNAICAVYAFMRKADDLADDESISRDQRKRNIDGWLTAWHQAANGAPTGDPIFIAVRDAVARFKIPLSLLDELVAGVTMDLEPSEATASSATETGCPILSAPLAERVGDHQSQPYTYPTFAHLYRYCYLVASVVGLVCIRIFGYTDPRAEKLAEETGIAFQLTNILRDLVEDASRNRVYLPLEDMATHSVSIDSLLHRAPGTPPTANERALLKSIADRAEEYYKSADALLPLIAPESRPALRVLVSIYHALLKRIVQADYDVFTRRASVPTAQKLAIMFDGLARMAWARLSG
ncbi:MAG: phytoene/squalene synthase family protein [Terracidiphilus sp.]